MSRARWTLSQLRQFLRQIDGKGYKAYKDIAGSYDCPEFGRVTMFIDYVQGDPYASPSLFRVRVDSAQHNWPSDLYHNDIRRIAMEDWLAREVQTFLRRSSAQDSGRGGGPPGQQRGGYPWWERAKGKRFKRDAAPGEAEPSSDDDQEPSDGYMKCRLSFGSGSSGQVSIDAGNQEVLQRAAVRITANFIEARMSVGLPARGRSVLGREAEKLLCSNLLTATLDGLTMDSSRSSSQGRLAGLRRHVDCVENQEHIRSQLRQRGLIAFVSNGSVLPRRSGVSDAPMSGNGVIPFSSPADLEVSFDLVNPTENGVRTLQGLGIPRGITLIVGGGYHGKSTILQALERSVYAHIPGDGREYVVVDPDAVKVRAEDGRRVEGVNISAFINNLPQNRNTTEFRTDDASGSTSQAAFICEAVESGSSAILLDEDTCASNFMIRDARMQALVAKTKEPITPFIDRVKQLYDTAGVSSIIVMGGSGDYFDVADHVLMMDEYRMRNVTAEAKRVSQSIANRRQVEGESAPAFRTARCIDPRSISGRKGRHDCKLMARGVDLLSFGTCTVDLRCLEQIMDPSQVRAIGYALHWVSTNCRTPNTTVNDALDALDAALRAPGGGVDILRPNFRPGTETHPGSLAMPRRHEVAAVLNRLRTFRVRPASSGSTR